MKTDKTQEQIKEALELINYLAPAKQRELQDLLTENPELISVFADLIEKKALAMQSGNSAEIRKTFTQEDIKVKELLDSLEKDLDHPNEWKSD